MYVGFFDEHIPNKTEKLTSDEGEGEGAIAVRDDALCRNSRRRGAQPPRRSEPNRRPQGEVG